jgi:acetyl esterase/lipase
MTLSFRFTTALVALTLAASAVPGRAQSNVRAWHDDGQTFVVWTEGALLPCSYEIYRAGAPVTDVSQATRIGRVFLQEWEGERLKLADPTLEWTVPHPTLGSTTLASDEGLFVFTPHAAADEHFFVVAEGETVIDPATMGSDLVVQTLDAVPTCHLQGTFNLPGGTVADVWAVFSDGGDDRDSGLPGFPILASAARNGTPHLFAVYSPSGAAPPPEGFPVVITLHGGGMDGSYLQMHPGGFPNIGLDMPDGLVLAHDDSLYKVQGSGVAERTPTKWIGYVKNLDPFVPPTGNPDPMDPDSVVVPYTQRRIDWVADWMVHRSPYSVDETRVALLGYSRGGAGALLAARLYPERWSSVTAFVPPFKVNLDSFPDPILGDDTTNLATVLTGPTGDTIHVPELLQPERRLSAVRDLPLTRLYLGRRDTVVPWDVERVEHALALDATSWGFHIYWDERDHAPGDWSVENPSWPAKDDTGQWVVPPAPIAGGHTDRGTAAHQIRYRNDASFPGFFSDDQDPAVAGRQPEIGDGDHCVGDAWGTWSGYYDWDPNSLVDLPTSWECTLFLTGTSAVDVDNALVSEARAQVALRRTQSFLPTTGAELAWELRDAVTAAVLQAGLTVAGEEGLVIVHDLFIPRDPCRVRLVVTPLGTPCLAGNVDTGAGGNGPEDVLLINGSAGGPDRRLVLSASDPFTLEIVEPESRTGLGAIYWLGAWARLPTEGSIRTLPAGLGPICMPLLLTGGAPQPRRIANNIPGSSASLGAETWPGPPTVPAPTVLLSLPLGLQRRALLFFQAIIRDDRSAAARPFSVSNGILVTVED